MSETPEPAGPRQWTPGAGLERLRREMPHLIPAEVSADDMRLVDDIIAAADRADGKDSGDSRRAA